jgi:hypothetical protein
LILVPLLVYWPTDWILRCWSRGWEQVRQARD